LKSLISLKFIFLFFLTSCVSFGSRAYKNLSPFAAPEKTRLIYLKQKNMTDLEKMLDQSLYDRSMVDPLFFRKKISQQGQCLSMDDHTI